MAKKITDKDGKTYVQVKPWYKRWWIWVIVVIVALFLIGSLTGNSESKSSSGSGSNTQTTSPSRITVDYDDYKVQSSKTYKLNYSNTDWDKADVKINKVTVY